MKISAANGVADSKTGISRTRPRTRSGASGGLQGHVGTEGHPTDHRLVDPELVEQVDDVARVGVHAVRGHLARLARPPVARQVEQDDPVAGGGQVTRQAAVRQRVQQDAVQVDEHALARGRGPRRRASGPRRGRWPAGGASGAEFSMAATRLPSRAPAPTRSQAELRRTRRPLGPPAAGLQLGGGLVLDGRRRLAGQSARSRGRSRSRARTGTRRSSRSRCLRRSCRRTRSGAVPPTHRPAPVMPPEPARRPVPPSHRARPIASRPVPRHVPRRRGEPPRSAETTRGAPRRAGCSRGLPCEAVGQPPAELREEGGEERLSRIRRPGRRRRRGE